jgi:methanogenic corrinoid protein MtbC1
VTEERSQEFAWGGSVLQLVEAGARVETALREVDRDAALAVLQELAGGLSAVAAFDQVVAPALERLGEGWEQGRISLAQLYMAGRITEQLAQALLPAGPEVLAGGPRLAMGVLCDRHVLGKRIVLATLRSEGYPVIDLGYALEPDALAARAVEERLDVLLVSVLMLGSALQVARLVEALRRRGSGARVGVGGAPFRLDPHLWRAVGADGSAATASGAKALVARLIGSSA